MKSKGFTLIELLAVIVILAVIALIATPLIMGTSTKAKKNAFIDTANGIIKAGENYQAEQVMTTTGDVEDLVISDLTTDTKLQYKGSKPKSGTLKITSDGKTAIAIWSGQFCAVKNYDDKKVTVDDSIKTKEECVIPVETTDTSCFITEEELGLLKEEDITIHKDKCLVFFGKGNYSPDEAEQVCNNQMVDGITLKQEIIQDYSHYRMEEIQEFVDEGVISVTIPANVLVITGYYFENTNCSTDVVIPEKINGKTVERIGADAFIYNGDSPVTSVAFPSTIKTIGEAAFLWHSIHGEINFSNLNDVVNIGYHSFYTEASRAENVTSLYIPNRYVDYLETNSISISFNNATLKIKKGSIEADSIVEDYMEKRPGCAPKIMEKVRETSEYAEYRLQGVAC